MPEPMPDPPFVFRLPAHVAARIRATAAPAAPPRHTGQTGQDSGC